MAHIKTYLRVKPTQQMHDDYDCTPSKMQIRLPDQFRDRSNAGPRPQSGGTANHEFFFTSIFKHDATQSEVFDSVAKETVQGFLNGYNGTIFAYGQTGTGKTFTMEGGARRFEDRGLAPRALSMVYRSLEARQEEDLSVHISFLEIYQEVGYDLLNPAAAKSNALITPFPKVTVTESPQGGCQVRNMSSHLAANEDVAQNLLMQGLANRKVAETSMNLHSSRSHAIFTIQLTAKSPGSDTVTRSKLHLVDLAGSERVSKSKIDGVQLTEAKYINLSLHYLESVIIALQQDAAAATRTCTATPNMALYNRWVDSMRPASAEPFRVKAQSGRYIPYRNSLLTMVLRDSLGGNCQTSMIATISMELDNLGETISTCRFAQRVACITNMLKKNEEIDDKSLIRKLRRQIADLETEVSLLRSGQSGDDPGGGDEDQDEEQNNNSVVKSHGAADRLTNDDKVDCAKIVQRYLGGRVKDPVQAGVNNAFRFRECMRLLKAMVIEHYTRPGDQAEGQGHGMIPVEGGNPDGPSDPAPKIKPKVSPSPIPASRLQYLLANGANFNRQGYFNSNQRNMPYSAPGGVRRRPSPSVPSESGNDAPTRASSLPPSTPPMNATRNSRHSSMTQLNKIEESGRASRDSYKSPFERKREKEIKQLSVKVNKTQDNLQQEKRHLEEFNLSIKEQQLQLLQSEIAKKIDAIKNQLVDQSAYLTALKHNKADLDLYKQEKLVERQLHRRKLKLEKRQELIENQLNKLNERGTEENGKDTGIPDVGSEQKKTKNGEVSLDKKFSEFVGKNGKVNSRQVLEMLQNQDKRQDKMATQIEQHRVISLSRQIEVKEAATRQKLQEFRERLRQQQPEQPVRPTPKLAFGSAHDTSAQSMSTSVIVDASAVPESVNDCESVTSAAASTTIPPYGRSPPSTAQSETTSGRVKEPFFIPRTNLLPFNDPKPRGPQFKAWESPSKSPDSSGTLSLAEKHTAPSTQKSPSYSSLFAVPEFKKSSMEMSRMSSSDGVDSFSMPVTRPRPKRSPADQWNKPYNISRDPNDWFSPSSQDISMAAFNKPKLFTSPLEESGYEDLSNLVVKDNHLDDSNTNEHEQPEKDITKYDTNGVETPGTLGDLYEYIAKEKSRLKNREPPKKPPRKNPPQTIQSSGDTARTNETVINHDAFVTNSEPRDFSAMLNDKSVTLNGAERSDRPHKVERELTSSKMMGSTNKRVESTNNHRMGLSSRTFEEALNRMLGAENKGIVRKVTFSHENYNKFARKGRKGGSKLKSSSTPLQDDTASVESCPLSQGASAVPLDTKNISIGNNLAKYLEVTPPAMRQPIELPLSTQSVKDESTEKTEASFDWRKKLAEMTAMPEEENELDGDDILIPYETPPETPEMKPTKIVSLKDDEKEKVFMSTAQLQKDRVSRIRQAQQAASVIQNAFRHYQQRKVST